MSKKNDEEFKNFISRQGVEPPKHISESILNKVRADLNPPVIQVFYKLIVIHSFTAVVTLSICPQFGFRVFGEGMGLLHVFMSFGPYGCMLACGAFFTGLSLLIAAMTLKAEEVRKIRNHRLLSLGTLTLLSLGFFIMVDTNILASLGLTWFAGSLLGSTLALELGWRLRFGYA